MNWKIFLLDDSQARHNLLHTTGEVSGLINALDDQAKLLGSSHTFSIGFDSTNPTLDSTRILKALKDTEGIWLVDLHIPHGKGIGPASAIVGSAGSDDLDLAKAVMQRLQGYQRKFVMISSQHVANASFNQAATSFQAQSLTFDAPGDIHGAVQSILALIVPELIYKRAFDEARNAFGTRNFHAAANKGVPLAMFDVSLPVKLPFHDLANWDDQYSSTPSHEMTMIQHSISRLMTAWQLDSTALNGFRAEHWNQSWRLSAAKAINGGFIHRSFIFAMSPKQVAQNCTPLGRVRICDRDMNHQQSHLGILGLQTLMSGTPDNGFEFSLIETWSENGRAGLLITLTARFDGHDGKDRFEEVLAGTWLPPAGAANSSHLSRAVKQVRDAFVTDGSIVDCSNGKLRLLIRLAEAEMR